MFVKATPTTLTFFFLSCSKVNANKADKADVGYMVAFISLRQSIFNLLKNIFPICEFFNDYFRDFFLGSLKSDNLHFALNKLPKNKELVLGLDYATF